MSDLTFFSRKALVRHTKLEFSPRRAILDINQKNPCIDFVLQFQSTDFTGDVPILQYDSYRFTISATSDYHNLCTLGEKLLGTNNPHCFLYHHVTLLYVKSEHENEPSICAIGNEDGTMFIIPSYFIADDPKLKELTKKTVSREETEQILRNNIV